MESIILGDDAFAFSLSTIIENLPSLHFFQLGWITPNGSDDDESCSLRMQNLPNLDSIAIFGRTSDGTWFEQIMSFKNISNLRSVRLRPSFDVLID